MKAIHFIDIAKRLANEIVEGIISFEVRNFKIATVVLVSWVLEKTFVLSQLDQDS